MNVISGWMERSNFLPHGYCLTWRPGLLWTTVGADAVIAASYYSIPFALLWFVRQRRDFSLNWLAVLFSAFIFACGTTHVLAIWTIWQPDYGIETFAKLLTAAASMVTAVAIWPMMPMAVRIPSVAQLQATVAQMEREIQQRRTAEQDLADTQESLAITLASIGAAFMSSDRQGRVTRMNPAAEAITGWSAAQALGQPLTKVLQRHGDAENDRNPVDVLLSQNRSAEVPSRSLIVTRSQALVPVELNAAVIYGHDRSVRGLGVVFRDMTQIDRAQAESQQLAALVSSSADAIIGVKLDGNIISWNFGAERIFGYPAKSVMGQTILMLVPPERMSEGERTLVNLRNGVRTPAYETVRLRSDRTLLDVSVSASPVLDSTGAVVGASYIVHDISQRKRNEQLRQRSIGLEAQNRQIQEANRLKSAFLANMSHELRTPLNAIIGFADLLHMGQVPADSPKHTEFLGHIRSSGRHLLQLINDVLDLSKVEAGKFDFFPEPIDLRRVIDEAVAVLHTSAAAKHLTIDVDVDAKLDDLLLDQARLKQMLFNYLSNAIKFTPQDGTIHVRATPQGDGAFRLEVEDSGIGIAPADLQRLFIDFQQLDSGFRKEHPGTGLGLALTKRMVQAQGGSVGVRSTLGLGSVFHAVLPRVPLPAPATLSTAAAAPITVAESFDAPQADHLPRVLMIEDKVPDQIVLAAALVSAGFAVDVAPTGSRAMELAASRTYAAITLDLLLPDCSSIEVLASLRADGPNALTPVVVVTLVSEHSALAGFRVSDVLIKPLQPERLRRALRRAGVRGDATRVLIVDADTASLDALGDAFNIAGIEATTVRDGATALQRIDVSRPDAIILDLMSAAFDGFAVLERLRELPHWKSTPVFIWTSSRLSGDDLARLEASAAVVAKEAGAVKRLLSDLQAGLPRGHLTGPPGAPAS